MAVEIRALTEAELPALVAVFGQEPYFRQRLVEAAAGRCETVAAYVDGHPAGDLSLWLAEPYERNVARYLGETPTLTHLEVAEPHRRRGIGTELIGYAERWLAERGCLRVGLGVGIDNHPAARLYDRLGYRDWRHGLVLVQWTEERPDGSRVPESEVCHWLVKDLAGTAPPLDAWDAWLPSQAALVLGGTEVPWAVAGGWAIDLALGRVTREHGDLEIAIPRADLPVLRRSLAGFELYLVGAGRVRRLAADAGADLEHHQVWVCDPAVPAWRMDTFLEPGDRETWVSHRDPRIRVPLASAIRYTADGIPYLTPTIVLLAKAKHRRDKDEADLAVTVPTLSVAERAWLAGAISTVHPGHPWLDRLM